MRRRRLLAWLVRLFIKFRNTDFNLAVLEACQYHQLIDDYVKSYVFSLAILSYSYHRFGANQSLSIKLTTTIKNDSVQ